METTIKCKESCYNKYRDVLDNGKISDEVHKVVWQAGGLDKDTFVDILGYEHHICDLEYGRIYKYVN